MSEGLTKLFRKISFGNGNMIAAGENNSFSFRIEDLPENIPKDVHFTIGYNAETQEINLHITRNVNDQSNKPKIIIAKFHLEAMNEALPQIAKRVLNVFVVPLVFNTSRKRPKYGRIEKRLFLDFSALESESAYKEGEVLETAGKYFQKRGGKGKYEAMPSFIPGMEQWSRTTFDRRGMRASIVPLKKVDTAKPVTGYLISPEFNGMAMILDGALYAIREDITIGQFARVILGNKTAVQVETTLNEAIYKISEAKTYGDTKYLSTPVQLFEPKQI